MDDPDRMIVFINNRQDGNWSRFMFFHKAQRSGCQLVLGTVCGFFRHQMFYSFIEELTALGEAAANVAICD